MVLADVSQSRLQHFARCASSFWVLKNKKRPDEYKLVRDYCHDRFCELCARGRAALLRDNLRDHIPNVHIRFVTLTLAPDGHDLRQRIDRLLSSFRRLRSRAFWKRSIDGGVAFLEVTLSKTYGHWHPHLHVLTYGRYLPKADLQQAWLQATGDSSIVDVSLVRSRRDIDRYVTKYVTKAVPPSLTTDGNALSEAILALQGRKLIHAFGSASRWQLLRPKSTDEWTLYAHSSDRRFHSPDASYLDRVLSLFLGRLTGTTESLTLSFADDDGGPSPPSDAAYVAATASSQLPLWRC